MSTFKVRTTLDERHRLARITRESMLAARFAMNLHFAQPDEKASYQKDLAALEKLLDAIEGDDQ